MSYWQYRNIRIKGQDNHTKHIVNTLALEIIIQYGVKQALEEQLKDLYKALEAVKYLIDQRKTLGKPKTLLVVDTQIEILEKIIRTKTSLKNYITYIRILKERSVGFCA